ncbi:hypothetical protein [Bacillus sp. Marseille-P3661]|nr:hypothetical protein [Bacillus sp. Marseille-P3661]
MGRGKSFNHKKKGHESQKPKYATKDPEFSVEPLASKPSNK